MCLHSLDHARARGLRAMQFNFVVSSNERAVRLWQSLGFEVAGRLPAEDGSFDAGVASLMLCSVPDQRRALAELFRVIRPAGELRFYEHVIAQRPAAARLQRLADATVWPRLAGGCHLSRDTAGAIELAGFVVERRERFPFSPGGFPKIPHILGIARRPQR